MRVRVQAGDLFVHAVAGTYVVLLGIDIREDSPLLNGLLGFAIHRTNHTDGMQGWLRGLKTFRSTDEAAPAAKPSSCLKHPFQAFQWSDYATEAGHQYTYRIVPLYGSPGSLRRGEPVEVCACTEREAAGEHSVYFNRGAAASQAYARRFHNKPPDRATNAGAYPWLSRGLEEGLLAFIRQARSRRWGLRCAFYEFHYHPVLQELRAAAERRANVAIVYDAKAASPEPEIWRPSRTLDWDPCVFRESGTPATSLTTSSWS